MNQPKKKPTYSPRIRTRWLKARRWPFHVGVIHPTGEWCISAGIHDTWGEGPTFEAAVDDAITNERKRGRGCCTLDQAVITEVPPTVSRQMLRAIDKLRAALTGEQFLKRCS